ncbi:ATP-binding protein [Azoarcus sp. KH32C]|uniref:ATP-binding protein n=1 Tax=Azoarcus sp. KH32C TaxID=748247 RepID=UPI0002385F0B|nr:ATP-binding protein [Azoarcus sp. KH32C]BAL25587.1 histidine kinase [Azoarcus sp. KH32C]
MFFHRYLTFRILAPIIGITLLVGAATIGFALYVTQRFADKQADTNLRWRAFMVRQIAEDNLRNMLPPGPDGGDREIRESRINTMLSIEDFARSQGLQVAVYDEAREVQTNLGDLNIAPPTPPAIDEVLHLEMDGERFHTYTVEFSPWRWRITVMQDNRAYEHLRHELTLGAWVAGGFLGGTAFLFMIYLTALMRHPIQSMIADLKEGRPPRYTGVAELEYLSTSISKMMADLGDKSAALERYRDELEERVEERTRELTEANTRLQQTNEELVRTHQQLLQSEKMASIGQLAAGVAHEINNPIGFVTSNLGTLDEYLRDLLRVLDTYERHEPLVRSDQTAAQDIDSVRREIDIEYVRQDVVPLLNESKEGLARVRKIVQDLKEFSHVGTGTWQLADLHKGIETTLNIVWNEIKYKATVVKEFGDLPEVQCLPSELNQVFMNMLVNAAQAISEKGTITIRTAATERDVTIEFVDTGKGIAPEHLPKLFEPFFTTKPVGQGTGLGLSLSYGIVRKHQGIIEVESAPGQGALFRIRLPIRQPEKAEAVA